MDKNMVIDKNYFVYEGKIPQPLRALFSELTNYVLSYIDQKTSREEVVEKIEEVLAHPYYEGKEDKIYHLCSNLESVCYWWEEDWRFKHCWPVIEKILKEENMVDKEN
ncbi:hypothetical protein [Vibrio sp. HN007]|uniref:hypothetical protein n=1 Tax=Vibrio iocasae TaxID=3098914 RepID=UPI0035D487E3